MKTRAFFLACIALLLTACAPKASKVHVTRFIMGTLVEFTVFGADEQRARAAIEAAAAEMQRIDAAFSLFGTQPNAVKAFNSAAVGEAVTLPSEVDALLRRSLVIAKASGDAFTPAIGGLSLLWGFAGDEPPSKPPPAADIARVRAGAASRFLASDGRSWRRLHPETKIDFGAFAKGYAIDRAITVLKAHGIRNAIVAAGGDLRAIGRHGNRPWKIGIRHPRQRDKVLGWLEISGDKSVVTSGDYERFFIYNGKRYHHILDPKSGWPADRCQSATVIAENAATADAWSTALFVLGTDGLNKIEEHGMQAVLVDAAGVMHTTSGLADILHTSGQPH